MSKKSFTLIETIVVIAVIGLMLPALFSLIFSTLQEQAKINRLSEVKKQGDSATTVIENVIRGNAVKVYSDQLLSQEQCKTAGSFWDQTASNLLYFKDKDGHWFRFYSNSDGRIASESSILSTTNTITSSKVNIDNFLIGCTRRAASSAPMVKLSFTLTYNPVSTRVEENASLPYRTNILLRNY